MREKELGALHSDSFFRRWHGFPRTYGAGKGWAKSIGRLYLAYLAATLALVIPILIVALIERLF